MLLCMSLFFSPYNKLTARIVGKRGNFVDPKQQQLVTGNLIATYPDQPSIMEVSLLLGSVGLLTLSPPERAQS